MVEGLSSPPQTNAKLSEQHVTELLIACSCLLSLSLPPPLPPRSAIRTPLSHLLSLPLVLRTCPPSLCLPVFAPISLSSSTFLKSLSISIKLATFPQSKKKTILKTHHDKRHTFLHQTPSLNYYISNFEHTFLCVCGHTSGSFWLSHIYFPYLS